ncbi:hypothetical protein EDC96DRAFT_506924, partial [Choanephora cucurbitarum]
GFAVVCHFVVHWTFITGVCLLESDNFLRNITVVSTTLKSSGLLHYMCMLYLIFSIQHTLYY